MNQVQSIPCPDCQTPIPFDINLLIQGSQFTCPRCKASIGIAQESLSQVKNAKEKFDEMKSTVMQQKMKDQ